MFRNTKRIDDLQLQVATLALAVAELKKTSAAGLAARVDELEAALDAVRDSMRSQFGRLNHKLRGPDNGGRPDVPDDAEFQALIELQNSHGRSN